VARVDGSKDTTPGSVLGTPEYMAPEQARGEIADGRADLYAFGVMLFEMLVGRVPLYADSIGELMQRKLNEVAPRVSAVAPGLPIAPELDEMIAGLLTIEPRDRLPDAASVIRVLRRVTSGPASSQGHRRRGGKPTIEMGSGSTDALAQAGTLSGGGHGASARSAAASTALPGAHHNQIARVAAIRSHQHGAQWQGPRAAPRLASMAQSGVAVVPTAASVGGSSSHPEPERPRPRALPVIVAMGAAAVSAALVTLGVSQVLPREDRVNGASDLPFAATPPVRAAPPTTGSAPVAEKSSPGRSSPELSKPTAVPGPSHDIEPADALNQDAVVVRSPVSAARTATPSRRRKPISKRRRSLAPPTGSQPTATTPAEAHHGSDAGHDEGPDTPSHASQRPAQAAQGPGPQVADPGEVTYDLKDPFSGN
ncbi:MAG: hypothetical protein JKY37_18905, partial [Nannocystaceae bacterium]|nr:hypothetical protein [Nannocystaceae bacterium]